MSSGTFLALLGPFVLACCALAGLVCLALYRWEKGWLALALALGGWALITVVMGLLSYNLSA
ncbi:hypothetical protein E1286_05285 [Nonomuraea terrae]|uniref:Uncharacterized protein n=1 Tax=Nonomuraea terrae TaxID=2530383 RepID=A0A4R4Z8R4_9ACTN|nr:hypothetical protein [Nonomuraea terrae]TDD54603.1 hypothetical protein E1286_05285 [Nonomuraea terrae]